MVVALFLVPLVSGVLAYFLRKGDGPRRALLVGVALAHSAMTAFAWVEPLPPMFRGWFALDALGLLFLSITSVLFLAVSAYSVGYLARERRVSHVYFEERTRFTNEPEAIFTSCLLLFLGAMTFVAVSHHFGLLWVGVEATTLASAPMVYFHRHHRSLEATWKYLLICSVGIALALLGNFLLAVAATGTSAQSHSLVVGTLVSSGASLRLPWLRAAFLFFLVGYGTKMGLAPLHTWLPDAHSESPSPVSALLSGALLNCAFLALLRIYQVCLAAGAGAFCQELLRFFGLFSMAIAAVFILGQTDYKRMLAYSSVEHMGILALGVGLNGLGAFGALFHSVNHSLTKAWLFLVAGNILAVYETKSIDQVRGLQRTLPISGVLWLVGFLAITGSPPFGLFLSELTILRAAIDQGHGVVAALYLALLAVIFIGMANLVLPMVQGPASPTPGPSAERRERLWATVPPAVLCLAVLGLGVYIPPTLNVLLHSAARLAGGP